MSRRTRLITVARRAWLLPVLVVAFLTLGLPHRLVGNGGPDASNIAEPFAKLCRAHGGTPTKKSVSAANPTARHLCIVRYGDRAYVMDAVTPHGWDRTRLTISAWAVSRRDADSSRTPPGRRARPSSTARPRACANSGPDVATRVDQRRVRSNTATDQ